MEAVDWFGDASLYVVDMALACCALESQAALGNRARLPLEQVPGEARVVIALSGTATHALQPAIDQVLAARSDASVVAFGACAVAGGPYWDSYAVTPGLAERADLLVAGCPPPPGAFAQAVEAAARV